MGIPLMNAEPEHLEYHAPSDEDVLVEDDDKDPEKDPSEEHEPEDDNEDLKEDPNEEHEPYDSDETKPFEEDETTVIPPPPRHRRARISVRPQIPMVTSTKALIDAFAAGSSPFPLPPTSPAYDQAPLGHRTTMIRIRDDIPKEDTPPQRRFAFTAPPPGCDVAESSVAAAARTPRGQYDFVDTMEAGQGLIHSPGHNTRTIARAVDRVEDVGYARALQASEHRMMTSIEETDRKDIRLEIDAVRVQRTAYETELQERQNAKDLAVTQMMRIHALEARARIDTVEDVDSSWTEGIVGLSQWIEKMESIVHISDCAIDNQVKFARCTLLGAALTWWNGHVRTLAYTQHFQELALMCTKFPADETKKVDKYISGLPDNIHGNVMSARPKTLDETIELANDLIDQKLCTYADRQNENKRKADDSSRNNQHNHIRSKMEESRLNIISCTKAQEYLSKGCDVFLAHVTTKEAKDESEGKRLESVPIVRGFPKVFPEDLPDIPPARQVEFQIDLVPGAAPVARAPYRSAPLKMKELAEQPQELFDEGFIRPSSSTWGAPVLFVKKKDGSFRMCID
nr:putative reverse transcriptase domain-containing protein [Tanacetum cinerariifolium]